MLALVGIIVFTQLGFWQLRRHENRRAENVLIESRLEADYTPLDRLLAEPGPHPDAMEWRRVEVTGTFLLDDEVLVQGRSYLGQSGHHVATPLLLENGRAILVNRGWVSIDAIGPPIINAEPPAGRVTIRGVVRKSDTRGRFGPSDPATGRLERVARVDISRLQEQIRSNLYEFYITLAEQSPRQVNGVPIPIEVRVLGEGSHLSYAVQWFVFALLVLAGYPILLYRTSLSRDGGKESE